jgi:hypothetical protein
MYAAPSSFGEWNQAKAAGILGKVSVFAPAFRIPVVAAAFAALRHEIESETQEG